MLVLYLKIKINLFFYLDKYLEVWISLINIINSNT